MTERYDEIKYQVRDHILTLSISRPGRMNAYTDHIADELIDALGRADQDEDVRAIILTGDPAGRNFCAGMDLGGKRDTFDYKKVSPKAHRDSGGRIALALLDVNKPTIAAINGHAVGVGFTMTLPCDFRIVSSRAKLGAVFARRGIVLDGCSSYILPRLVGMTNAMKIALTGKVFRAEELAEMGLFYKVAEPDRVLAEAEDLARDLAFHVAPVSYAMNRKLLWSMQSAASPMDAHEAESELFWYLGDAADADEGINSFLEKREPDYSMRVPKDLPPCYPWFRRRGFREE